MPGARPPTLSQVSSSPGWGRPICRYIRSGFEITSKRRAAKQQNAPRVQSEVEHGNRFGLRLGVKIDEEVAARNHVETRERRVRQQILHGEDHATAQFRRRPVTALVLNEETGQPRLGDIILDRRRVEALTRGGDRVRVDVRSEDLQFDVELRRRKRFEEEHGDGIGLFAGAASGNPHAHRQVRPAITQQGGDDRFLQSKEHIGIPEESGDIDQQIIGKQRTFLVIAPQHLKVARHVAGLDARHRHSPRDPAPQCAMFVEMEIVGGAGAQQFDDFKQSVGHFVVRHGFRPVGLVTHCQGEADQRIGDLHERKHLTYGAGGDGAAGHAVKCRLVRILGDDQSEPTLGRGEAEASVRSCSREDDAGGSPGARPGQGPQQKIEWHPCAMTGLGRRQVQDVVFDRQISPGRNYIDLVSLDQHGLGGLLDRHRRMAREQIDEHAMVVWVQVLDQNEGHSRGGGQARQQSGASIKAAG